MVRHADHLGETARRVDEFCMELLRVNQTITEYNRQRQAYHDGVEFHVVSPSQGTGG